jgi:hypothetical protein
MLVFMLIFALVAIAWTIASNNHVQSENVGIDLTNLNVSIGEDKDDDGMLDPEEVSYTINYSSFDPSITLDFLLTGTFSLNRDAIDYLAIEQMIDESSHDILVKVEGTAYLKSSVPIEFAITGSIDRLSYVLPATAEIQADVDVDPNTLNLRSKGKWITSYIELPEGWDVSEINRTTILLNDTIPVDPFWVEKPLESVIGDYDNDTVPDLMVKFNRTEVSKYILDQNIMQGNVTLTITGQLYDTQYSFVATDTIRVINE